MSIRFNADEIFEIAERIEENGAKFYTKAAEFFKGTGQDQLLLDLAKMEKEHKATFAKLRADSAIREIDVFDPDEDVKKYLQAFADGQIFDINHDPAKLLVGNKTLPEIIRIAIGLEKDSVVFYLGIRDMVPPNLGKNQITKIIAEEKNHVTILSDLLRAFDK